MKNLILCITTLFLLTACGGKNFTVNQVDTHSYVLIKGESKKEQVIIDANQTIILGIDTKEYTLDESTNASKIQISEGTHTIKIIRNEQIILKSALIK